MEKGGDQGGEGVLSNFTFHGPNILREKGLGISLLRVSMIGPGPTFYHLHRPVNCPINYHQNYTYLRNYLEQWEEKNIDDEDTVLYSKE